MSHWSHDTLLTANEKLVFEELEAEFSDIVPTAHVRWLFYVLCFTTFSTFLQLQTQHRGLINQISVLLSQQNFNHYLEIIRCDKDMAHCPRAMKLSKKHLIM